jgi:hypothetical protein
MAVMVIELVAAELDGLHERVAGRFGRAEPRARGCDSLSWDLAHIS